MGKLVLEEPEFESLYGIRACSREERIELCKFLKEATGEEHMSLFQTDDTSMTVVPKSQIPAIVEAWKARKSSD